MLAGLLHYVMPWDLAEYVPLNGALLAIVAVTLDCLCLIIHHFLKRFFDNRNFGQIRRLQRELATINPKEEFPRYSKLERQIARLKRNLQPEYRAPLLARIFRTYLVPALLMKKWICEFPALFWTPFNRAVAFPFPIDGETVRVGFSFFWISATRATNLIYTLATGDTL